jgi:anti-sigma28 factor (negative regulator of flagellin synthesis)
MLRRLVALTAVPNTIRLNKVSMHDTDIQKNEESMRSCSAAYPSGDPSSPQMGAIPALETPGRRSQGRVTQIEQLNLSPLVRAMQQASQLLAHTLDVREAKITALRQEVGSSRYRIRPEQLAEKLLTDHLLDLCCSATHYGSIRS